MPHVRYKVKKKPKKPKKDTRKPNPDSKVFKRLKKMTRRES